MRVIEPSVELFPTPTTPEETLRHIERCGRICYKSEGKITDDSHIGFIRNLIKRGHEAMLEHGVIAVQCDPVCFTAMRSVKDDCENKLGTRLFLQFSGNIISGNARAWRDFIKAQKVIKRGWYAEFLDPVLRPYGVLFEDVLMGGRVHEDESPYLRRVNIHELDDLSVQMAHRYATLKFTVDRGVSHEIVRHRPASYGQESTRYCNYAKDAFGKELTFIKPCFWQEGSENYWRWQLVCRDAEACYIDMIESGASAQEARSVLPNSLKTEIVMTAPFSEWDHFLFLRTAGDAHPQMREVATRAAGLLAELCQDAFRGYCHE